MSSRRKTKKQKTVKVELPTTITPSIDHRSMANNLAITPTLRLNSIPDLLTGNIIRVDEVKSKLWRYFEKLDWEHPEKSIK